MAERRATGLQLAQLLAEVENAPPVAAADVVAEHLRAALGASAVSFLIADFSGQALIRLGHDAGRETADRVPLAGTPHGEALATQHVQVVDEPDGGVGSSRRSPIAARPSASSSCGSPATWTSTCSTTWRSPPMPSPT